MCFHLAEVMSVPLHGYIGALCLPHYYSHPLCGEAVVC